MPLKRFVSGLAAALSLLLAGAAPAHAGPPVPLLWKVSDADNAVYLLGSFHLLRREDYPLSADVDAAFADAEGLVFELAPEEANAPDLPARMAQAAMRTRAGTLERDLGPALWGKLQGYAAAHQLPLAQLAAFDPWFIGLTIALMEMGKQGLDTALGLDRHFMEGAARAGKPTAGLERGDEQIAVLAGMSLDEQRQMLADALQQAEEGQDRYRDLHAAWRAGDAERMWREMAAEMKRDYPALYRRINVQRNDAWLPKIEQRLARKDDDTLVVVGALHLLGEDGVVEKLRAKGYTVERICSACRP